MERKWARFEWIGGRLAWRLLTEAWLWERFGSSTHAMQFQRSNANVTNTVGLGET